MWSVDIPCTPLPLKTGMVPKYTESKLNEKGQLTFQTGIRTWPLRIPTGMGAWPSGTVRGTRAHACPFTLSGHLWMVAWLCITLKIAATQLPYRHCTESDIYILEQCNHPGHEYSLPCKMHLHITAMTTTFIQYLALKLTKMYIMHVSLLVKVLATISICMFGTPYNILFDIILNQKVTGLCDSSPHS